MANEVLLQKRNNLLEINKNGPEIFINRGFINFFKFFEPSEIINFIEDKNAYELKFNKMEMLNKICGILANSQTIQDFNLNLKKYHFDFVAKQEDYKDGKFIEYKKEVVKRLIKERGNEIDLLFKYFKQATEEYYDSGKWCLYLSFGLLEGNKLSLSNVNIPLRSPLLSLPIGVNKLSSSMISIYKRSEDCINNEILKVFLNDNFDLKYIDDKSLGDGFQIKETLKLISDVFENCKIEDEFSDIAKLLKADFPKEEKLTIKLSGYISFFNPVGGKMLEDYDAIINSEYVFPANKSMFANITISDQIYNDDNVFEINRPLNLIQKKAVLSSLKTNTLVYGPPGTGKSEVVTNILVNNIINNKNVLVVSEKKAALDVIVDRLGKLNNITMRTYDDSNQEDFYNQIILLNKLIINANQVNFFNNNSRYLQILKYYKELDNFTKTLNEKNIDIKHILSSVANDFDYSFFKNYENQIALILNKINSDKISNKQFIENFIHYNNVYEKISSLIDFTNSLSFIFDQQNIDALTEELNSLSNQKGKQWKLIYNFLETEKIKTPWLGSNLSETEEKDLEKWLNIFNEIKEKNISFVLNYLSWKNFIIQDPTKALNCLDFAKLSKDKTFEFLFELKNANNNLQTILDDYWYFKTNFSSTIDKLVCDHYLYLIKQKMLSSKDLQEKWVDLVRRANLPKKINYSKIIKQYYDILKIVYPIWILSPDNVSNFIPLKQHEFACGIFDEASQMRLERGIPLIYRCTNSVVSGDDKQLKPTSFFGGFVQIDEVSEEAELDNVESLLDKAKTSNWIDYTLSNHYRSYSEQLISFSNKYIYDDKLLCITKNNCFDRAIDLIQMETVYDRTTNTNPQEAKMVVELLNSNFKKYEKIVVITFNQKQTNLIESLCYENISLTTMLEKYTLRIRSIENVQGDEADLVIISTTFGKDADGRFIQNFGPVGQSGGKNRINVMVTRAKEKMIVVKSFKSSDITSTTNENLYVLKMFFNYVENLNKNDDEKEDKRIDTFNMNFSSQFVDDVCDKISKNTNFDSIDVIKNYSIGSHYYDVAIINKSNNSLLVALMLDSYEKILIESENNKVRIAEIDQQKYYQDRGYKIIRFNEVEWWMNSKEITNKINIWLMKNL